MRVEGYEYTAGVYPCAVGSRRAVFSRNWLLADMDDSGAVGTGDLGILFGQWQKPRKPPAKRGK